MSQVSREEPVIKLLLGSLALLSGLLLGAGGLIVGTALTLGVVAVLVVGVGIEVTPVVLVVIALLFTQGVGCGGVALSYYKLRPVLAPRIRSALDIGGAGQAFGIPISVPSLRQTGIVLAGYTAAIVWVMLSGIVLTVVQNIRGESIQTGNNAAAELGRSNPELLLLLIPASILLIGPGEELLFRGVVQGRIRERFSRVPGIAIASLFFAALHIVALVGGSLLGNLVVVSILFGTASVFGVAYEYAENIVVPSLIHGLYNATLFTLLYVSLTFSEELQQGQALLGLAG